MMMLLSSIERHIDLKALKKDFRKLAVNLMTAGIVGVYINHYVGTKFSTMFWTSVSIATLGAFFLAAGIIRRERK